MSTRATYTFASVDRLGARPTIYIHHDGYTAGAAMYFYNALTKPSKGCLATQFIRANDGAELTGGRDAHGDTEFHYEIRGNGPEAELTAYGRKWTSTNGDERWQMIYCGSLLAFIHKNPELIEDYKPFRMVKAGYGSRLMNETTASQRINGTYGPLEHLRIWSKSGACNRQSGNWKSVSGELRDLVEAFPSLMTDEIAGFIAVESEVVS